MPLQGIGQTASECKIAVTLVWTLVDDTLKCGFDKSAILLSWTDIWHVLQVGRTYGTYCKLSAQTHP
eukprot:1201664-Amphidinium_carterae.1